MTWLQSYSTNAYIWGTQIIYGGSAGPNSVSIFCTHLDHCTKRVGDPVKKGDLLGFIGWFKNTRYDQPFHHLHIGVWNSKDHPGDKVPFPGPWSGKISEFVDKNGQIKGTDCAVLQTTTVNTNTPPPPPNNNNPPPPPPNNKNNKNPNYRDPKIYPITVIEALKTWGTASNNVIPTKCKEYKASWTQQEFDDQIVKMVAQLRKGPRIAPYTPGSWGANFDYNGWAKSFLTGLGAPINRVNIWFMFSWFYGEWPAVVYAYNPLSTKRGYTGSKSHGAGVQAYLSYADGLKANILTVTDGFFSRYTRQHPIYLPLWDALKKVSLNPNKLPIDIWNYSL